jgi:hypothetical protein
LEGGVINSFIGLIIEKILPSPTRRGAGGEVKRKDFSTHETVLPI